MLDEKNKSYCEEVEHKLRIEKGVNYIQQEYSIKEHFNYPKQENEHNALDDANWNLKLYKFIKTI